MPCTIRVMHAVFSSQVSFHLSLCAHQQPAYVYTGADTTRSIYVRWISNDSHYQNNYRVTLNVFPTGIIIIECAILVLEPRLWAADEHTVTNGKKLDLKRLHV